MSSMAVAPAAAASGPAASGGCGTALALDRDRVPVDGVGLQQPQARVRETERPAHGEDVAGPRARAEHRLAVESAERGDRDHDDPGRRRRQVAAEHRHPGGSARLGQAAHVVEHPLERQLGVGDEGDEDPGGPPAHRRDVGEVLRHDLVTDVGARGPRVEPVAAEDDGVGRGDGALRGDAAPRRRRPAATSELVAAPGRRAGCVRAARPRRASAAACRPSSSALAGAAAPFGTDHTPFRWTAVSGPRFPWDVRPHGKVASGHGRSHTEACRSDRSSRGTAPVHDRPTIDTQ